MKAHFLVHSWHLPNSVRDKGSFCFIKALVSFRRALLSRLNVELVEERHRHSNQSNMHGRKLKSIHSTKSQGCSDPLDKMVPYLHITYKCPPVYPKSSSDHLASLVAQRLKCLPAMQETRLRSLSQEDPLEKEMATHSSILAWRIPWREEPGGLQSMGSQRVGHS